MSNEVDTLGDALPRETKRVREVLAHYQEAARLCPQGNMSFAISMIERDLEAADKAMISGDVVEMIRVYQTLKETE